MNSDLNNAFNALSLSSIAYCESRGLSIETMSRFGLLESKCNRYLVIPVCDSQGGQLFFAGRRIAPGGHVGRYQYYGHIDRSVVFGLDVVGPTVTEAVLVEGFFDVMVAYERGYRNFIGNMACSTIKQPWWELKRNTLSARFSRISIAFDGFPGGHPQQKAAVASFLEKGIIVDEIILPSERDPASLSKEEMLYYFGKPT